MISDAKFYFKQALHRMSHCPCHNMFYATISLESAIEKKKFCKKKPKKVLQEFQEVFGYFERSLGIDSQFSSTYAGHGLALAEYSDALHSIGKDKKACKFEAKAKENYIKSKSVEYRFPIFSVIGSLLVDNSKQLETIQLQKEKALEPPPQPQPPVSPRDIKMRRHSTKTVASPKLEEKTKRNSQKVLSSSASNVEEEKKKKRRNNLKEEGTKKK